MSAEASTSRLIDVPGGRLEVTVEVEDAGSGRPVPAVLAAHPADDLSGAAGLLRGASGRRTICVNPRGLGGSSPGLQSIEDMADDIEAVRRQQGFGKVVFWGMSGGGWIGLSYARRHPAALAGLILESVCPSFRARVGDPACLLSPLHPSWRSKLEAVALIAPAGQDAGGGELGETEWVEVAGVGAVMRRRAGAALLVAPFPVSGRMRAVMPSLLAFDARPWLRGLRVPALVMSGTADPIVPLSHARALADGLATRLVALEGAGHVPSANGSTAARDAVRRFLAG